MFESGRMLRRMGRPGPVASIHAPPHRGVMRRTFSVAVILLVSTPIRGGAESRTAEINALSLRTALIRQAIDQASCSSEYADGTQALSNETREFERRPESNYAYCLRNTAIYECLSYSTDGKIRRRDQTVEAHGTAFAYREKNGEYYLLTNDHVASWPLVTDDDHPVEGVPTGCKKIDEQLRLVRDESDDYQPGQIAVQRVVTDPYLDTAVLKTRHQLNVMPYRVGRSALLRAGNVVQIRGYPLGLMEATNVGKIVTPYDLDRDNGWSHVDFVTDALVTTGNSGSPVFAISCRTGDLELVGIYHAGYRDSPALNDVIAIDQLHDLMENFRRSRPPANAEEALGTNAHSTIVARLKDPQVLPLFNIGNRIARARLEAGDRVAYEIFNDHFPARDGVEIVLLEVPDPSGGSLEKVLLNEKGGVLRRASLAQLDAETHDLAQNLFDLARRQFLLTVEYRAALHESNASRKANQTARDLAERLDEHRAKGEELVQGLTQTAGRLPIAVRALASNPEAPQSGAPAASGTRPPH